MSPTYRPGQIPFWHDRESHIRHLCRRRSLRCYDKFRLVLRCPLAHGAALGSLGGRWVGFLTVEELAACGLLT